MKKFLLLALMLCMSASCYAIEPTTDASLQDAMRFGIICSNKAKFDDADLMGPWTFEDSELKNPYRFKEQAIVYTPYMLAALQSKNLSVAKKPFNLAQIKSFVGQYNGISVIGMVLNGPVLLPKEDISVELAQGKKLVKPYDVEYLKGTFMDTSVLANREKTAKEEYVKALQAKSDALKKQLVAVENNKLKPGEVKKVPTPAKPAAPAPKVGLQKIASLEYQFYFDNNEFNPQKDYTITVSDKYCGKRVFKVKPGTIK